jgi:hypothetical protein
MANSFAADFKSVWAKEQQRIFYKTNVARMIADMSFQSDLKSGVTLNRPYRSANAIQKYTRGTAITIDDKTDTQETLTVNAQFATGFYVDDFDKIQSNYDLAASYGKDNGVYLSNQVDADILGEAANATSVVDDGTLGGTTGNGVTATTSNVLALFSEAKKKLAKQNMAMESLFGVISPELENILVQYGAGRDTVGADKVQDNGFFTNFYGFKLYRSNQSLNTAVLALATNPADGETVVIQGTTFTFKTVLGASAGNVLIGADADASRLNLTTLINAPGTTTAQGVALTGDNLRNFTNLVTAVNDAAANTLTVSYKGAGSLTVTETLGAAADIWTTTKRIQHNLFGILGAPTLVMQKEPTIQIKEVPDKLGKNMLDGMLYGFKTFADNAKRMVDVKLNASTF